MPGNLVRKKRTNGRPGKLIAKPSTPITKIYTEVLWGDIIAEVSKNRCERFHELKELFTFCKIRMEHLMKRQPDSFQRRHAGNYLSVYKEACDVSIKVIDTDEIEKTHNSDDILEVSTSQYKALKAIEDAFYDCAKCIQRLEKTAKPISFSVEGFSIFSHNRESAHAKSEKTATAEAKLELTKADRIFFRRLLA